METARIAKATVEQVARYKRIPFVRQGLIICDEEHFAGWRLQEYFAEEEKNTQAVYVSIFKGNELRGRSGAVFPRYENLAAHIIKAAYGAANQDPSFEPVEEQELPFLTYEVDLISPKDRWILMESVSSLEEKKSSLEENFCSTGESTSSITESRVPGESRKNLFGLYTEIGFRSAIEIPRQSESPMEMFKKAVARANILPNETPAIYLVPLERHRMEPEQIIS